MLKRFEQVHKIAKRAVKVCFIAWLVLLVLMIIVGKGFKYAMFGAFGLMLLFGLIQGICEKLGVKSDEEKEGEEWIRQVIDTYIDRKENGQSRNEEQVGNYNPFVTEDEVLQNRIVDLLRKEIPESATKKNFIKNAVTAQYLVALSELGFISLADQNKLRLWVGEITGKKVPSVSQFNEAISIVSKPKVQQTKKHIVSIVSIS